ncbi:hypothetical protein JQ604_07250 [Bradyrhizobium jicamae]|uniref:hypothetical protein n=1 Tax=Bradyrhizobium jicamae TaxID=280332 RepID=UPI001BABDAFB|nr:hypothetical protein [Bradyrhizobium jicamae]MBR0751976.1 hypothetical protein [Bradyrhizobium jicamae]
MSRRRISVATAGALLAMTSTLAQAGPETSLLYLEPVDWPKQSTVQRLALASDFMRIFCTDQTMPAALLVECLDGDRTNGPMFERAIACVASRRR